MESSKNMYGSLVFCKKDGTLSRPRALISGKLTIGGSEEALIRLKIKEVEPIHCILDINDNGIATLVNKSQTFPVTINNVKVKHFKVLYHKDKIDIAGKQVLYFNENISKEDVENAQKILVKNIITPMKRQSLAVFTTNTTTNKSPKLRTKIPVFSNCNFSKLTGTSNTTAAAVSSPRRRALRNSLTEKSKTLKLIPARLSRKRLSLGLTPVRASQRRLSTRKSSVSENIVSSTMTEDEIISLAPSSSMNKTTENFIAFSPRLSSTGANTDSLRKSLRISKLFETNDVNKIDWNCDSLDQNMRPSSSNLHRKNSQIDDETFLFNLDDIEESDDEIETSSRFSSLREESVKRNSKEVSFSSEEQTEPFDSPKENSILMENSAMQSYTPKNIPLRKSSILNQNKVIKTPLRKSSVLNREEITKTPESFSETSEETFATPGNVDSSPGKSEKSDDCEDEYDKTIDVLNVTSESEKSVQNVKLENVSIIVLSDSSICTPENSSTSVIYVNSESQKKLRSSKKLANSSVYVEQEIATPKSAIKSRRSTPYNPVTEDISPATPPKRSAGEPGFKTPINTPGLFEDIRKSVLKSRISKSLVVPVEVEEVETNRRSSRRLSSRESVASDAGGTQEDNDLSVDNNRSLNSFASEEALSQIEDTSFSTINTPKYFNDLTDKPVVVHPFTKKWASEPRPSRPQPVTRHSLHAIKLANRLSVSEDVKHFDWESSCRRSNRLSSSSKTAETCDEVSTVKSSTVYSEADSPSDIFMMDESSETSFSADKENDRSVAMLESKATRRSSRLSSLVENVKSEPRKDPSDKLRARSLSEPRRHKKLYQTRRSLHVIKLSEHFAKENESNSFENSVGDFSENSECFEDAKVSGGVEKIKTPRVQKSPRNDLSDVKGLKKLLATPKPPAKSPKNDLSDVKGLKKLLATPKIAKSPKNDLTKVPNLRNLVSPKTLNSPKNDLSDVVGVKKLLATPKVARSPKNDLTKVPNLRNLMCPRTRNSPKNDLSDVKGIKKLLATPKEVKSPKNDLGKVPNLRRIMYPRNQNSPRNDLRNVAGVKKLMATPKPFKEVKNDLSDPEGVREMFDISGCQPLSSTSDIENNEDLFDKVFMTKPRKTYRGKSVSPKAVMLARVGGNNRKTMGDVPVTSPRVEKWVQDQVVLRLQRVDDNNDVVAVENLKKESPVVSKEAVLTVESSEDEQVTSTTDFEEQTPREARGRLREPESLTPQNTRSGRAKALPKVDGQTGSRHGSVRKGKEQKVVALEEIIHTPAKKTRRGKKVDSPPVAEVVSINLDLKTRSRRAAKIETLGEEIDNIDRKATKGKRNVKDDDVKPPSPPKRARRGRKVEEIIIDTDLNVSPIKKTRGRNVALKAKEEESVEEIIDTDLNVSPIKKTRGRNVALKAKEEESVEEKLETNKVESSTKRNSAKKSQKDKKCEVTSSKSKQNLESNDDSEDFMPKRTRRNATPKPKQEEYIESNLKEVVSKTRGKNASLKTKQNEESTDNKEVASKTRGRNASSKAIQKEESTVDLKEVASKTRGRNASSKAIQKEESTDALKEVVSKTRGRTVSTKAIQKKESKDDSKNIKDQKGDVDLEKALPKTRGRKGAALKIKNQEDEEVDSENAVPKTKGKKVALKNQKDEADIKEALPKTRGKKAASKTNEDKENESEESMPKAGSQSRSRKAASKTKQQEKEKDEVKVTPLKNTRGSRKRKSIEMEEKVKVDSPKKRPKRNLKKEPTVEVVKEAPVRAKRGRKAKVAEEVVVETPTRTRGKKGGNFKYGSDFIIETPDKKKRK